MVSSKTVPCLRVHAEIADPAPEVRRARAQARRGDAAWQQRLQRYEDGDTLIVAVTASAMIDRADTWPEYLCFGHEVVWIDRPIAPRVLTESLVELAHRDFQSVGARLRDHGVQLSAREDAIAVELIIDPAVARRLDDEDLVTDHGPETLA